MPERRKKQIGEIIQSPGMQKQHVMMTPKEFHGVVVNAARGGKPIKVIHRSGRDIVFEDRRLGEAGIGAKLRPGQGGPMPVSPAVKRRLEMAVRMRELLNEGMSPQEVIRLLSEEGFPAETPGRRGRGKR